MHLKSNSFLIVFLFACSICIAQPVVRLSGPHQARPGNGTGFILSVERNGISGLVRFVQSLPEGWEITPSSASTPGVFQEAGLHKAIWLSFPLQDTVSYSYLIKIPPQADGTVMLTGKLEYFEDGKVKSVGLPPFQLKLRRHFSRF